MTGITLSVGLLAGVVKARASGEGCDVDASLFDVALHQLNYSATWFLNKGHSATRLPRSSHFSSTPVQTFRASDGWIFIMCMTDKFWTLLIDALGRPELGSDPRFNSMGARAANRDALTAILDAELELETAAYWVEKLGATVPVAPVYDIERALENPFVEQVGMIQPVPHPEDPNMRLLANPLKINGERLPLAACAPLGADNEDLLGGAQHAARA